MRVEIDSHSGFCFGVVRAISRAEEALQEQGEVFSLGDIVHNRVEVQRLERLGMHTVTHDQMPELGGRSLFIRAHGEPPSTYWLAEELGIELIDATCPVVAKLQRRVVTATIGSIKSGYFCISKTNGHILIASGRVPKTVISLIFFTTSSPNYSIRYAMYYQISLLRLIINDRSKYLSFSHRKLRL